MANYQSSKQEEGMGKSAACFSKTGLTARHHLSAINCMYWAYMHSIHNLTAYKSFIYSTSIRGDYISTCNRE